ncbi:thioesterase family protein [Thermodesulfobacteriota bacterium]
MHDETMKTDELLKILHDMYANKIPFNKVLGLRIASLDMENVRIEFDMKEEFVGNFVHGILHGGVISAVLDATGGLIASLGVIQKMEGQPVKAVGKRLSRIGTIDLRVDYLRPGSGAYFVATGSIMRAGKKVTVTRMELHNDQDLLIAVGTGTYIVG